MWNQVKIHQDPPERNGNCDCHIPPIQCPSQKNISFLPGKNMKVLTICLILFPQTFQVGKYGTKVWELTSHFAEQRFPSETTPEIIIKEISQKNTLQICIKCNPPPLSNGSHGKRPHMNYPTAACLKTLPLYTTSSELSKQAPANSKRIAPNSPSWCPADVFLVNNVFYSTYTKTNRICPLKRDYTYFSRNYIWTNHWVSGDMLVFREYI